MSPSVPDRRTRLFIAVMAVTALMLTSSAVAGPPSQTPGGQFGWLQMELSPPRAGTRTHAQPVALTYSVLLGNDLTGQPPTGTAQTRIQEIRLARGMTVNAGLFPACRYKALVRHGPPACPLKSKVGNGTVIIDFRPVLPALQFATCSAFNGRDAHQTAALLVWCKTDFGASGTQAYELVPAAKGFGPGLRYDPGPTVGRGITESWNGGTFTFPDTMIKVHGRRVSYFDAPTSCNGSWRFEQVSIRYNHTRRVVTSTQPCVH